MFKERRPFLIEIRAKTVSGYVIKCMCVTISLYTGAGKRFNRWSFITIRMGK